MTEETPRAELREMITSDQILAMIHMSRTTLFRLERDGLFPQGQVIGPHRKLWFKDEVAAWQHNLQDPNSPLAAALRRPPEGRKRKRGLEVVKAG
ncbi:prophage regulatory protein [Bradyrhizobium sp. S3.9.2]|uniref:helix-turn-helix transcriptional regulator n=1 Tax=Bradyrhizobium sp. S3.9.2 TaxID=3156432 RepID=UPI00339AE6A9